MGQALTGVTAGGQQQFANGAVLSVFKLVIGADGTWSRVRSRYGLTTLSSYTYHVSTN